MGNLEIFWVISLGFGIVSIATIDDGLSEDYYYDSCPQVEEIIGDMMEDFISQDISVAAHILRMHFHDCFVRGCDGSILINSSPGNQAERDAAPNNPSIVGYELIDQIKETLESECPGVVSCADIITYAARESVYQAGNFERYAVRGGRKDGTISQSSEVLQNLPTPGDDVNSLAQAFANKGLSIEDMVTLSGAHSIGVSHCSSLGGRQNNFNNTGMPDPTLDSDLAELLREECPSDGNSNPTVLMDTFTPNILDNMYYTGILENKGVFTSDQALLSDELTQNHVRDNADQPSAWEEKFADAMRRLGEIEVLTGLQGEIREQCGYVNNY